MIDASVCKQLFTVVATRCGASLKVTVRSFSPVVSKIHLGSNTMFRKEQKQMCLHVLTWFIWLFNIE